MSKKAKRLSTLSFNMRSFSIVLQKLMLVLAVLFSVSALFTYNIYINAAANPQKAAYLITGNYYVADPIPISYSYFNAALSPDPRLYIDEASMVYGAPYIQIDYDQHSYELLWDYEVKSPLINAGCPEYISASAPDRASDPDGTRPDIGAVYYKHHHREYDFNRVNQSGIHWKSFPVIDDRSQTDDHYWNETGMFFGQYMTGAPYEHRLETVAWSYDGYRGSMSYDDYQSNWTNTDYSITQPKGFKIRFRDTNQGSIPP
ncbi:MAG: hypothetical protein PHC50_05595, partial [Candidatus Cloacimonetes bacterium]|nr:hypothetical protein [Candidatus Cloacimonadota bacterium]